MADSTPAFRIEDVATMSVSQNGWQRTSIRVASDGIVNIAFYEFGRFKVSLACLQENGWVIDTVDDRATYSIDMLLDPAGQPVITYSNEEAVGLATRVDAEWTALSLFEKRGMHTQASTFGRDGSLHTVYLWSSSGGLYLGHINYALRIGTDWQEHLLESSPATFAAAGRACDIALDSRNSPHICIVNSFDLAVRYWDKERLASTPEVVGFGFGASIEVDQLDIPHVSFHESDSRQLMYSSRTDGEWQVERVDSARTVWYSSLALDTSGAPHIAYYGSESGDLWYATRRTGSTLWHRFLVDHVGDVGQNPAISVDELGNVHIAYFDGTRGALKYATTQTTLPVQKATWSSLKSGYR